MAQNYVSPFTGDVINPTDVSYTSITMTANTSLVWPAYLPPTGSYVTYARIMDVTANVINLQLALPQGNQGTVGSDTLITNRGANTFIVTDSSGGASVTLAPGVSRWFYLSNNATLAGVWQSSQFGVGTGGADAASLAGNGLTTSIGKLATSTTIQTFNLSTTTLDDTSRAKAYVWLGGVGTLTLPLFNILSAGWFIVVRNNGSGSLTLQPSGASLINGLQNITFLPGQSAWVVLDAGSGNYYTLGTAASQSFSFSTQTFDVDNISGNTLNLTANSPIIQRYVALAGTRATTLAVTLPATTTLYVIINSTNNSNYNLTFQLAGSSQPPVTIKSGEQFFITSDSNFLYVLNQTSVGFFSANDGSATTPTHTFLSENTTGFYRVQGYRTGLTVGGNQAMFWDGADPNNMLVQTPATFVCRNIDGGEDA